MLEPTVADALHLVNAILDAVSTAYPVFDTRFEIEGVPGDDENNAQATREST